MGVLIPADYDIRTIEDERERRVVENLRDRLSDSWFIIPRLDVANPNRPYEIDILIFHEGWGIAGIEVKGGQLEVKDGEWYRGTTMLTPSPPRQAHNACYELRDKLRGRHRCFEHLEIQFSVALPDCNDVGNLTVGVVREQILFQADLINTRERIHKLMLSKWNIRPLTKEQIEEFVAFVRPNVQFKWDAEAQARDARVSLNLIMREQVRAMSTLDMNNTVFVRGAAGTGKTQLALQWAQRALANGERVLLTCYNIPLADYLASQFMDQPNIVVGNFVDMFAKINGMPHLAVPEGADNDWYKTAPVAHINEHAAQLEGKFDTIIVDEAQDFYGEWISSLLQLLHPDGQQRLLMVGDAQQNLFNRNALDVIEDMGATHAELLLNCRNTHGIGSLLQNMGGAQVANASPDGAGIFPIEVNSQAEMLEAVGDELEDLIGVRSIDPANVLIVTVNTADRDAIRAAVPGGYNCASWEEREDQNVVCETVHRTKGLEYDAVVFATTSTEVKDHLLYVGMSRAISILTVIAPAPVLEHLGLVE